VLRRAAGIVSFRSIAYESLSLRIAMSAVFTSVSGHTLALQSWVIDTNNYCEQKLSQLTRVIYGEGVRDMLTATFWSSGTHNFITTVPNLINALTF